MAEICKNVTRKYTERTLRFILLTLRSVVVKVKMSSDSSFELFMDFLNSINLDIPDGADLIDEVGIILQSIQAKDLLGAFPVVHDFLTWVYDEGLCDFFLGTTTENGLINFAFRTEGIKEFYSTLMEGFGMAPPK